MPMKALIVDDERLARNELKRLLENFPAVEVIGEAANTEEASQLIEELQPDVVFLDIQMPGKTGFEWLEEWDGFLAEIIFTTAFDEYAIKAFEVNALDYLLKPIDPKRLADVEALVLENNVVAYVTGLAKVTEKAVSFEELSKM